MFRNLVLGLMLVMHAAAFSQFQYEVKEGPLVKVSGFDLLHGFMGGLNSPQFTEMDLNRDGRMDLIVFDRADFRMYTFLRSQKNQFVYAPQYESQLPTGHNIYVVRDMNEDGLGDVFTTSESGDLLIYRNRTTEKDEKLNFDSVGAWYYRNQYASNFPILYNPLSFGNANTDLLGIVDMDGDGDIDIVDYDQFNLSYMMFKDVRAEQKWHADTFEFQNMDYCFGYFWEGFDSEIRLNTCPLDLSFPLKLKPRHIGGAGCWFFDEDGDGDMEMYMSNLDFKRITRLKNGRSDYKTEYDTMIQVDTTFLDGKSFDSYVFPGGYILDVDNDGLQDMIIAPNAAFDSKERNQIHYYRNYGTKNKADFKFERDNFIIEQMLDLGGNTSPALMDVDKDGDLDMLVLNNGDYQETNGLHDRISLFENIGTKLNPVFELKDSDFLNLSDSMIIGASLTVGDINNDGSEDILIGTLSGQLYWFSNNNNTWTFQSNQTLKHAQGQGESSWSPAVIDYNKDGINDLLIGFYNGNVGLFKGKNRSGNPSFELVSSHAWGMKSNEWMLQSSEPKFSSFGYASPAVADIDNDGDLEVVLGGFNSTVRIYHIEGHNPDDSLLALEHVLFQQFDKDTISSSLGGRLRPCLGDLTADSIPDLILGNLRGGLNFASHISSKEASIGVKQITKPNITIKPNPIRRGTNLEIFTSDNRVKWTVEIYDINGRKVMERFINKGEPGIAIKTEGMSGDMYIVKTSCNLSGIYAVDKIILIE